jgi:mannose-6-phosphate isomerase
MKRVEKPWGHEIWWAHTDRYAGKILFIKQGARLSLQHHEVKDESILVLDGVLGLELEDDHGVVVAEELRPQEARRIAPGRKHRFSGVTDCTLVEVSTAELDDVVRHQDDFGRI